MTQSALEQPKFFSKVVADRGDFELMEKFKPLDAATNPSLILKAGQQTQYAHLVEQGDDSAIKRNSCYPRPFGRLVRIGTSKDHRRRVSTEADARLSFEVGRP
jgi:transaldolase